MTINYKSLKKSDSLNSVIKSAELPLLDLIFVFSPMKEGIRFQKAYTGRKYQRHDRSKTKGVYAVLFLSGYNIMEKCQNKKKNCEN